MSTTADSAVAEQPGSLRRSPGLRRWIAAELASSVGDQFLIVVLAVTASRHGAAAAGAVLGVGAVPGSFATLISGAVVDRLGPRRSMLASDIGRTVVLGIAAVTWTVHTPGTLALGALAMAVSLSGCLYEPGAIALAPSLVPESDLGSVFSARMTAMRIGMLVGAPVAGLVVASADPGIAVGIDAVTFAISAGAVFALPRNKSAVAPSTTLVGAVIDGYRYIGRHRVLMPALLVFGALELGLTGLVNVGLPLLAHASQWSAGVVGLMLSAFGLGAAIGPSLSIVSGKWGPRQSLSAGSVVTAVAAISLALAASSNSFWPAVLAPLLLGAGSAWMATTVVPRLQAACEAPYLGRFGAAMTFTFQSVTPLSLVATGFAARALGLAETFVLGAALTAAACIAATLLRAVRSRGPVVDTSRPAVP